MHEIQPKNGLMRSDCTFCGKFSVVEYNMFSLYSNCLSLIIVAQSNIYNLEALQDGQFYFLQLKNTW